ncbi:MAG: alpha/beta hydrolase family protein, partial [Myxococcota bacterium]|nr:alpha/beta hydrolase family protein [Myxococcota bacterium]
ADLVAGWLEARLSFEPPPPPDLWDDQGFLIEVAQEAKLHLLSHRSEARDKDVGYMVFEPSVQDPRARFPVLYLLHGAYDGYTAWPDHAERELAAFAREFGLIIVTPDGDPFGWYVDSPVDSDSQIETYLFDELMPAIEADFPVLEGQRAIGGLSMGGHGALSLALRHPGTFVSASSMSGVLELTRHEDNSPELADRLGSLDEDPAFWEGLSVTHLLQSRGAGDLRLRFTCGLQDRKFIDENQELHALLEELGIPHEYQESRGKHSWEYWTSQLETHLRFHAEYLSGDGVR